MIFSHKKSDEKKSMVSLINYATIQANNCTLDTVTDLIKLRINANKNTEIKIDLTYHAKEKTLTIVDEMAQMNQLSDLEELFSSQEDPIKQLANFEYIDSNTKYTKEGEYLFETNKLKSPETKIKLTWGAETKEHVTGKAIETILTQNILAPEAKYKIQFKEFDEEAKTENLTPINLFEFKNNDTEMRKYLEEKGTLNGCLETLTLNTKVTTTKGKEFDSKTYIFIIPKNPFAALFGGLPEKMFFKQMKRIEGPQIDLLKNFLVVSKIDCPEGEEFDLNKFGNDLLFEAIKKLEAAKIEILQSIQEEVLQILLRSKMVGTVSLADEVMKLLVINYYEADKKNTIRFVEFVEKFKDVQAYFSVLPNINRKEHPSFENITEPIIEATSVIHEQIFLNSQNEKIKSFFERQVEYLPEKELSEEKLELSKFIAFFTKEDVKFTNRLVKNPLNVARIERISPSLLALINPIGGGMNMFYSSRSLIEISNNEVINEYLLLLKNDKKQLVLDILDLYLSCCVLSRIETTDNFADLQMISHKFRRDPAAVEKLLEEYETYKLNIKKEEAEKQNTDDVLVDEKNEL